MNDDYTRALLLNGDYTRALRLIENWADILDTEFDDPSGMSGNNISRSGPNATVS